MDFIKIELTKEQRIIVAEFIEKNNRVPAEVWLNGWADDNGDVVFSLCLLKITDPK